MDKIPLSRLIYKELLPRMPTRCELITYTVLRLKLYKELGKKKRRKEPGILNLQMEYPALFDETILTQDSFQFYANLFSRVLITNSPAYQKDMISHFGCLLLYGHKPEYQDELIKAQMEILRERLRMMISQQTRISQVKSLKYLLQVFTETEAGAFQVPNSDWNQFEQHIDHLFLKNKERGNNQMQNYFAKVPIQWAEGGLKKRKNFVRNGYVYADSATLLEATLANYGNYLRKKLQKYRIPLQQLINKDSDNQLGSFIQFTLDSFNQNNLDEELHLDNYKLNLHNIESLSKRAFPPCMLNLNKKLKEHNHLRHDGRRQLWLFFKACGMDVNDNKSYFHNAFKSKVSNSDLKSHMYNIEHAYGLVGNRKQEKAKNCVNIITGAQPKKGEYHGCPFRHWKEDNLVEFLHRNYNIAKNSARMRDILQHTSEKEYHMACGYTFQGALNITPADRSKIPEEYLNKIGISPSYFYYSAMSMLGQSKKTKANSKNPMEIEGS